MKLNPVIILSTGFNTVSNAGVVNGDGYPSHVITPALAELDPQQANTAGPLTPVPEILIPVGFPVVCWLFILIAANVFIAALPRITTRTLASLVSPFAPVNTDPPDVEVAIAADKIIPFL
jgi:hypothetical protein